jgi:hypothetical protein
MPCWEQSAGGRFHGRRDLGLVSWLLSWLLSSPGPLLLSLLERLALATRLPSAAGAPDFVLGWPSSPPWMTLLQPQLQSPHPHTWLFRASTFWFSWRPVYPAPHSTTLSPGLRVTPSHSAAAILEYLTQSTYCVWCHECLDGRENSLILLIVAHYDQECYKIIIIIVAIRRWDVWAPPVTGSLV